MFNPLKWFKRNKYADLPVNLLEGRLQMQIGKNTMVMECGDSVYFEAMQPHGMLALDGKPAKFLAIITPGKK